MIQSCQGPLKYSINIILLPIIFLPGCAFAVFLSKINFYNPRNGPHLSVFIGGWGQFPMDHAVLETEFRAPNSCPLSYP